MFTHGVKQGSAKMVWKSCNRKGGLKVLPTKTKLLGGGGRWIKQ